MATADMSDKEMEASISLLHMKQPSESDVAASENRDALHASLMRVVATQASDELSLPRISAVKKVQKRGARLTALSRELTLEELRPHFGRPIVEVAREFGICTTFLKKICRRCGIKRWPHRQIRSLNRTIQMLEQVESVASTPQERAKYATQIEDLKGKQRAVMEDPDANAKLARMKKYTAPKGIVVGRPDSMSMQTDSLARLNSFGMANCSTESLSALVVAVDSVTSVPEAITPKNDASALPGTSPLGVQIPSSALAVVSPSLTTPLHATASNPTPLALKISPTNRKLALLKANDGTESRLRSSSIGSLQDKQVMEEGSSPYSCNYQSKVQGINSSKMEPRAADTAATPAEPSDSGKAIFECNVCLDTVSSPVVTLCGHLYCWPCLYQWMQNHSECPVCKAGISEDNVIPVYARGAEALDPRTHQQVSDSGIPHRPRGQRPDAEQLRRRRPYNFGTMFNGNGQGNPFAMSPTIGFFPALFGVPYQPPGPVTHHQDGTPLTAQEARQQVQQAFLSRFLLIVGSLVILCLITF